MKRIMLVAIGVLATVGTGVAFHGEGPRRFAEFLNGLEEAPAIVSTTGTGTFRAWISRDETEIRYELTFKDLEGEVRQAHIHVGWPQNSGGIVLWLCDSAANPSPVATTPECTENDPTNSRAGQVSGTLTEADLQNSAANGIAGPTATTPGEFAEVVALIKAGRTYVNLHSTKFPPGEIRSQIGDPHDHHRH